MVILEIIDNFDKNLIIFINNHFTFYSFQLFFNIITIIGTYTFFFLALYISFSAHKPDKYAWMFYITGFSLTFFISAIWFKDLFARARPFIALPDIKTIATKSVSFSFPSGHASMAAAGFYIIKKLERNKEIVNFILILSILIALSRLFLKVHYLTDIIAGYFLGILIPFLVYTIMKKNFKFNFKK